MTVLPDEVRLLKSELDDLQSRSECGTRFLSYGTETASLDLQGRTLSVHLDQGPNQSTLLFSADVPVAPTVTAPDLSFLPAPDARTVRKVLDANPFRDKTFRVESITGRTLAGKGVTMQFGLDQVGLNAGCNGGGAGYTIVGDEMTFTSGSWTAMACMPEGVMQQEAWLGEFASGATKFALDGSRLTISKGGTAMVLSEVPGSSAGADPEPSNYLAITTIDEIVDGAGSHPLPELEQGTFWYAPSFTLSSKRLVFDVGCGQYIADFSGSFPSITLPVADGTILHDCPPNRSALAAALRLILSGPVTIDRDGAFITFTGRDGLQVTAHSGYQNG
ncbi:META domain-containing protein [Nakamurella sp. A5-74]|uniref:META domain-containing protein n=1 Tax=Nakamurella sp. A5-74 TaxID=3158264 RepID=A0AAU8DS53_9ACTN